MKLQAQSLKLQALLLVTSSLLLVTILGCEAFVRKFTRKPKKEELPKEEMVLVPQEYKVPQMSKDELYRQHFLFWKSWHDELIESLSVGANHKKQRGCIKEAIKNLMYLKALLNEQRQKGLEVYLGQLNDLKGEVDRDAYGNNIAVHRHSAERIKRNILRDFSYNRVKGDLM